MNCKHAQRQFHDLADGRLPAPIADELRRHLAECTDCRVSEHRSAQLQRLLALKRHEQPAPAYFDNFLGEFHQRLAAANAPQPSWWDRLVDRITVEPVHAWRYGLAGALGLIVVSFMTWWTLPAGTTFTVNDQAQLLASNTTAIVAAQDYSPIIASADTGLLRGIDAESTVLDAPGGVIIPASTTTVANEPRYVLDHLAMSPASYEAANVHF